MVTRTCANFFLMFLLLNLGTSGNFAQIAFFSLSVLCSLFSVFFLSIQETEFNQISELQESGLQSDIA